MRALATAIAMFFWIGASTVHAGDRVNPFAPPATKPAMTDPDDSSRGITAIAQHPRLRGVLHSTRGSMANLDGHVLSERESALGYRLLAVHEHSADFRFRGQRIRLYVTTDKEVERQ